MNRHVFYMIAYAVYMSVLSASCSRENTESLTEDFSKFIELKPAEQVPHEPGVPFNCFPKEVGELGFNRSEEIPLGGYREKYQVSLSIDVMANYYGSFDKQNLSVVILQYLDENNELKIDTIMDGHNVIERDKRNRFKPYFSDVEPVLITKQSGDPVYFAVFYSPYAHFDMSVTMSTETQDGMESLPDLRHRYSRTLESFHISEIGKNYNVYSQAMYLP